LAEPRQGAGRHLFIISGFAAPVKPSRTNLPFCTQQPGMDFPAPRGLNFSCIENARMPWIGNPGMRARETAAASQNVESK
jgi:hypothetical protein